MGFVLDSADFKGLEWQPDQPQFEALVADTLGPVHPNSDRLDGQFLDWQAGAGDVDNLLSAFDQERGHLDAIASAYAHATPANYDDLLARFDSNTTNAINSIDPTFDAAPGVPSIPAVPNIPPAPKTSGGGALNLVNDLESFLKGVSKWAESLAATVAKLLAAIPVYGWIIAGVVALVAIFWHGADPNQVPAAIAEQTFELPADVINHLNAAGFLATDTALAFLAGLIASAAQAEKQLADQYGEVTPFRNGTVNATRTINNLAAAIQARPRIEHSQLIRSIYQTTWDAFPKGAWYPQAVKNGEQIYWNLINGVLTRQVA